MTLRQYLTIMIFSTILCWVAWTFVLVNVNPFETSTMGFIFFYLSFFLSLIGTFSLLSFGLRNWRDSSPLPMFHRVEKGFQDGLITATLCILLLILQGQRLIRMWNLLFFLGFCIVLLIIRLSSHRETSPNL